MTNHSGLIEIMDTMLYSLVPIVFMCLSNTAIIYKLMMIKYKELSRTNESVSKSSTRGSVMVVTVSLTFIMLTSPRAVDSAIQFYIYSNPYGNVFLISMQYLNHSINGILYCILGGKFREELLKVILCCRNRSNIMHTTSTNMILVTTG